jgi:hypothetical protein
MRRPNYRFERAERDRMKQAKKEGKARRQQQQRASQPTSSEPAAREHNNRGDGRLGELAPRLRLIPARRPFPMRCKMSGTQRLPPGEPRKASQRRTRRAAPLQARMSRAWRPGDVVHWGDRIGNFDSYLGDSVHAKIVIADRTYRVRVEDLA